MPISKQVYILVGVLLLVLSLAMFYINAVMLGSRDYLLLTAISLPLVMAILYFLIGINKLRRTNITDISLYVALALTLVGWISLTNVTLIVIPLAVLIIGLFVPEKKAI